MPPEAPKLPNRGVGRICQQYRRSRRADPMFRFTLSYIRYVLSALSTVAFGLTMN
jgi:hypothetical protein